MVAGGLFPTVGATHTQHIKVIVSPPVVKLYLLRFAGWQVRSDCKPLKGRGWSGWGGGGVAVFPFCVYIWRLSPLTTWIEAVVFC